jgi:hypothetical protein
MFEPVDIAVKRLDHAGDLPLPSYETSGSAGMDIRAAEDLTIAPAGRGLIGSGFAAVLALIEWCVPGSFVASSGAAVDWQQMVYFSYVTLTTLGYGDITPVGSYAQSFVAFEAIGGTLYTVMLLSRLVGLHASRE